MQSSHGLSKLHEGCNPSCITDSFRRGDCTARFTDTTRQQVTGIDCDKCYAFPKSGDEERPDFILVYFGETKFAPRWFVLEMKGRVSNPGHIVRQLQAGADAIQSDPRFQVEKSPHQLTPLILHDGHIRAADFVGRSISFFGKRRIFYPRCGVELDRFLFP